MTTVVEANNGIVLERRGDHVLAVFTGASDAVRAAAAVREAVRDFAWPGERDPRVDLLPGADTAATGALW